MKAKIYTYYLATESGDTIVTTTEKKYENAIEFMKEWVTGEYEGWKDEGYADDDIPYADFIRDDYEIETEPELKVTFLNSEYESNLVEEVDEDVETEDE